MKTPLAYVRNAAEGLLNMLRLSRTVNSAEMQLTVSICTANIAGVETDGWAEIAPYGDFPSPDGRYTQHFDRGQAETVVKTWNSLTGKAARAFKNLWHHKTVKYTAPVWDGHPESDKQRWPIERLLAEITDLRAGETALEGRVTWNAKGMSARTRGPLYPSPLWWHMPPAGDPPTVFPELLESVGLVPTPNISSVPAWTQNATLAGNPQAENQNQNDMTPENIMALRKALGLPESADFSAILTGAMTANAAVATLAQRDSALQTANSAKADLENKLNTANGQITTLTGERDGLKTANTALASEVADLRKGLLDIAEGKGAITPAERGSFETRLNTANTRADVIKELPARKAMNTKEVEIGKDRVDLSTANARASALESAIAERMEKDKCDRTVAYSRVKTDPKYAPLFAAMADPTRKSD